MEISYYLLDPTGNKTILVETPVAEGERAEVAKKLLAMEPEAEQVGYVSFDRGIELNMAGGEFCGNATVSTAFLYCMEHSASERKEFDVTVKASGEDDSVSVHIIKNSNGTGTGTVEMPLPKSMGMKKLDFEGENYELPLVSFNGISHLILESRPDAEKAEEMVRKWSADLECDCLGLMFQDPDSARIVPLVYVKNPETLYWESSCASGTTAVGAYLAGKTGCRINIDFSEPGGKLHIEAEPSKKVKLTEKISFILCEGERKHIATV